MMKSMGWRWMAVLVVLVLAGAVFAQEAGEVTEGDLKVEHGQVNWTDKTIIATGSGAPDLKAPNVAVARLGAERVAKMDALRNILETLKGVRINAEITVENEMVTNSKMRTKVQGVARRFKVLKTKYYSDGGVDLIVQMSLDGQLASTLVESGGKAADLPQKGDAKHSGLIINAKGLKMMPALAPKILDESGKVIYSADFLAKQNLEERGVAAYFKAMDAAKKSKRVGANPLVLKALKLSKGAKTDVVLSNADAEKLKDPDTNLKYLAEGRVILVVD
jgi:hypothetical protein